MPGSTTTPDLCSACVSALQCVALRSLENVGIRDKNDIVAQWLAYMYPCRRFDLTLTDDAARLGASVVR